MVLFSLCLLLIGNDFPICTYNEIQNNPDVIYAFDQYYVIWLDYRSRYTEDSLISVFGSRVTTDGIVLDQDGKRLFDRQVDNPINMASDGTNLLVVLRDSC